MEIKMTSFASSQAQSLCWAGNFITSLDIPSIELYSLKSQYPWDLGEQTLFEEADCKSSSGIFIP